MMGGMMAPAILILAGLAVIAGIGLLGVLITGITYIGKAMGL